MLEIVGSMQQWKRGSRFSCLAGKIARLEYVCSPLHVRDIKNVSTVRTGIEYLLLLADWVSW